MIRVLLILGVAFADKLDRTYLPPPGSELSGGNPDALEVPLEQPKLQYPSKDEYLKSPQVAIGIDRQGPKGPLDIYSTLNSSTYTPATYVLNKDVYSTTKPGDDFSHYVHDLQNSFNPNPYQNFNQPEHNSFPHDNTFQTTENYPQLIQGVVSRKDNFFGFSPNQIKSQGENNDSVKVDISNSLPNKSDYGQNYSSQTDNNFKPSTLSPSIIYNYSSTENPKQFYSNTPATQEISVTTPISHTSYYSPVFDSAFIEKRPERIQAQTDREAVILNYENSITSDGYAYTFDTSNGIHGDESGIAQNGVKAKGSYSYVGDDGKLYSVKYTADEYGFQPQGEHLPTSPPIPEAILKVIEQAYKDKEAGIFDDGGEYYGEEATQNSNNDDRESYPIYDEDNLNRKESNQRDDRIFRNNSQIKGNKTNFDPHTSDEGYSYQQGILDSDKKSLVSISSKGYSSSTVNPNELTTRISTNTSQYPEFNYEKPQNSTSEKSIFSSITSTIVPKYQTKTQLNETNGLPIYDNSSKPPGFIDQYDENVQQNIAVTGYPKNKLNNTTPRLELSTNIPIFGNSYAPNIDIVHTDKTTTEKNIGEDFNGPKQNQRFDPLSGYYY
ncbi:uncharacterized protein LOC126774705 [Nymphalis io]|uniref:uncharacterized protein LOC126774705 n=1 Tax=Inachis io TaxID=171585 RepID=UPI0021686997|nr:uncharacterized protein LOC126774705 [Nymphalis io]